jgi:hypothetical protein
MNPQETSISRELNGLPKTTRKNHYRSRIADTSLFVNETDYKAILQSAEKNCSVSNRRWAGNHKKMKNRFKDSHEHCPCHDNGVYWNYSIPISNIFSRCLLWPLISPTYPPEWIYASALVQRVTSKIVIPLTQTEYTKQPLMKLAKVHKKNFSSREWSPIAPRSMNKNVSNWWAKLATVELINT